MLPLAGTPPVMEGGQHRPRPYDATVGVGEGDARAQGLAAAIAGEGGDPGGGLQSRAVGRVVAPGAALAVAGERDHDQVRLGLAQRLVVQAVLGHDAGGEALNDDIGMGDEALEQFHGLRLVEVQGE